jgi:hypothetical protein
MRPHSELRQAATEGTETAGADMNPGDQAPPGSPQTGENVCRDCLGKGIRGDGSRCETCGGTGKVIELVGDA